MYVQKTDYKEQCIQMKQETKPSLERYLTTISSLPTQQLVSYSIWVTTKKVKQGIREPKYPQQQQQQQQMGMPNPLNLWVAFK